MARYVDEYPLKRFEMGDEHELPAEQQHTGTRFVAWQMSFMKMGLTEEMAYQFAETQLEAVDALGYAEVATARRQAEDAGIREVLLPWQVKRKREVMKEFKQQQELLKASFPEAFERATLVAEGRQDEAEQIVLSRAAKEKFAEATNLMDTSLVDEFLFAKLMKAGAFKDPELAQISREKGFLFCMKEAVTRGVFPDAKTELDTSIAVDLVYMTDEELEGFREWYHENKEVVEGFVDRQMAEEKKLPGFRAEDMMPAAELAAHARSEKGRRVLAKWAQTTLDTQVEEATQQAMDDEVAEVGSYQDQLFLCG
jgi:hypothetical protein